jgi:hypothetical protein
MTRETVVNAAVGAYRAILARYHEYKAAASRYESPNPEDDEFAKLAIAGFSSIAPIERWSWEHLVAIRELRADALSDDALAWHEECASEYARFACICYGALFALRAIGFPKDDDDMEIAGLAMPAFMMGHLNDICGMPAWGRPNKRLKLTRWHAGRTASLSVLDGPYDTHRWTENRR